MNRRKRKKRDEQRRIGSDKTENWKDSVLRRRKNLRKRNRKN